MCVISTVSIYILLGFLDPLLVAEHLLEMPLPAAIRSRGSTFSIYF